MECGKNKMAAKNNTRGLWGRFTEVKLSKLEVPEYVGCHECAPMSHATLQAIKERASTGTTRVDSISAVDCSRRVLAPATRRATWA